MIQQKNVLVALCLSILLHASFGAQRYVATTGSDSAACTMSSSPCATLRYALQQSGSGDIISIAAGTYTGANFIELVVPSGVTITGAGIDSTVVDLASAGRAFIFDGIVGATVSAMTLRRGSASAYGSSSKLTGGCALIVNADVNITEVKFDACRANGNTNNAPAGAIYIERNSTATIERSQFINCRAGIAGAMFVTQSDVTIRDTLFAGCMSGDGGWGGALVPEEGSKMLIEGCTFRDGYSNFGGGIDDGGSAVYTVRNTLFQNNSALYGGGVYTFGTSRSVYENCTFLDNVADNAGGGIRTTTNSLSVIKNCVFRGNSAGSGGGVSSFSDLLTTVEDSYFYNNLAQQQGGGIASSGPTVIQRCVFDACRSGFISAGVDFVGSLNLTMVDTVLRNNVAFRGAGFSGESGEVATYHLRNCTFENNVATSSAGAIITAGQAIVDLDGAVFTNNGATNGGAIQTTVGSQLYLKNAKFIGNSASYGGAVYFSDQSKADLINVEFESNTAVFYGGAVYQDALSQPTIADSRFFNNSARGGGAYALSQYVTTCVDLSNIEFSSNQATIGGGALFFQITDNNICDFSLGTGLCSACSFSGNSALFGDDIGTSSSRLQFSTSPPSSLASSQLFTIDVQVIDMFAQTVKQARDLLIQVSVTEDAVLKGVVEQEVSDNGVAQFKLLKILASPESVVTVNFKAIPSGPQDVNFTIAISQCNSGSQAYLVDSEYHCLQVNEVKQPLRISIYILASLLIALSVALLIILIAKRNHSVIRKASPVLCWVIVIGAIICYTSTYFWLQSGDGFCVVRVWLLCLGFAMMYGSFFAKEWRLWRLFTVKSVKPMTIRDATLLKAVAILVSVEATVMLFWFIFFPYLEQVVIDLESTSESITYQCYSSTPGFLYALLVFNCALLLFGCFLAIKTRKLPSNYNESKHLAFSIYNATLTLFVVVPVASVLPDPDSIAIAVTAGILFETTMSLLILFAPKMYLTLNEGVILATLKKQAEKLQSDLLWKRKQIAEFEKNGTIEMDFGSTSTPTLNSSTDVVRGQPEVVTMRTLGPITDSKN